MCIGRFPVRYTDQFYEDLLLPNYSTVLAFCSDTYGLVGAATAFIQAEDNKKDRSGTNPGILPEQELLRAAQLAAC